MLTAMTRLPSPRSASGLYSPLDKGWDEIRLITIEPIQLHGPVQCNLHKVSLKDIREEYSCFKKSMDEAGKSARQILIQWAQSCRMQHGNRSNSVNQLIVSKPSCSSSRFNWGDFAALSYVWATSKTDEISC